MPDAPTITVSYPVADVAALTLDMPGKGANVLSQSVLQELDSHLQQLEGRSDIRGLIIRSGKPGQFIAGADLREFVASLDVTQSQAAEMCQRGRRLFARLSQTQFPTVAAIDGICVGGGAELVSWCDRRVMSDSPKTQFGFPEVKLGLFPGWGGTARAPRIAGLGNAVEMITGGESISAQQALAMGWASDVVPPDRLMESALAIIREEQATRAYDRDRQRCQGPVAISPTELGFLGATAAGYIQQQTGGHYPAPLAALETILAGSQLDCEAACRLEADGMARLFGSPVNAALLNIFFLTDLNKKDRGVDRSELQPREIRTVSILGAGIMGAGIAAANLKREVQVLLTDARSEAIRQGVQGVLDEVAYDRETKQKDFDRAVRAAALLNTTTDDAALAASDLVIEAVVENEQVKREVLQRLEQRMKPGQLLATNTSTIPVNSLAQGLEHPQRFCGIHFFNPVRRMKLVEVIRGQASDDQTIITAVHYAKRLGKMPVVVKDGPGFLVNRLLLPYMDEALKLVEQGLSFEDVDKAARRFGMPMGPIELYDMVGLDTALFAGKVLCQAFPDRFTASPIVPALVAAGRLGQKSGRGFFLHVGKKRPQTDPEVMALLKPFRSEKPVQLKPDQIIHRLFLPMLVEASRVLEEGLVRHPRDVDIGMVFGTGFPPFRGGLLHWADSLGAAKVVEFLKPLEPLGKRVHPTALLQELAAKGRKFYDGSPS